MWGWYQTMDRKALERGGGEGGGGYHSIMDLWIEIQVMEVWVVK